MTKWIDKSLTGALLGGALGLAHAQQNQPSKGEFYARSQLIHLMHFRLYKFNALAFNASVHLGKQYVLRERNSMTLSGRSGSGKVILRVEWYLVSAAI